MGGIMRYTPTQERMLTLLNDRKPHSTETLRQCLWDDLADPATVRTHISLLRMKLRKQSVDLICRAGCYQLVDF